MKHNYEYMRNFHSMPCDIAWGNQRILFLPTEPAYSLKYVGNIYHTDQIEPDPYHQIELYQQIELYFKW